MLREGEREAAAGKWGSRGGSREGVPRRERVPSDVQKGNEPGARARREGGERRDPRCMHGTLPDLCFHMHLDHALTRHLAWTRYRQMVQARYSQQGISTPARHEHCPTRHQCKTDAAQLAPIVSRAFSHTKHRLHSVWQWSLPTIQV